ncbi:MAG: C45 family autoproteolytic acyltransferase/hydrolase [Microbacterium sp.]
MELTRLEVASSTPAGRGAEIGSTCAAEVRGVVAGYLDFFELIGIPHDRVLATASASLSALRSWRPGLAEELRAMADAARLPLEELAAVAARTEVLAASAKPARECSTFVHAPPAPEPIVTMQTWDWHGELAPRGLVLRCRSDAGHEVRLFTEFGMPGKIGVNSAGIGVHFNILTHVSDSAEGGVPVHAVARAILDEAESIADAEAIVRSAALSASTVFTVFGGVEDVRAVSIEASPAGVAVVEPVEGVLVHTNSFLDPALAAGDTDAPDALSAERLDHLREVAPNLVGGDVAARAAAFAGTAGEAAVVCFHDPQTVPVQDRWATLLTVGVDVDACRLLVSPHPPPAAARAGFDVV